MLFIPLKVRGINRKSAVVVLIVFVTAITYRDISYKSIAFLSAKTFFYKVIPGISETNLLIFYCEIKISCIDRRLDLSS